MDVMPERTELRTARLLLRPFQLDDAKDVLEFANEENEFGRTFSSDEEFASMHIQGPVTHQMVDSLLAHIIDTPWRDHPRFAIVSEGKAIGEVELKIDHDHLVAELAYGIARRHWGKGFATEAAHSVLGYGFNTFNLAKVYAWLDPRNVRSKRVLEKLGMRQEGLLRSHGIRRGKRVDSLIYGLLRDEWEAMK